MPLCQLAQRLQKLTHAFPYCTLYGSRIVHDLRRRIEAHGCPAAEIVLRPTAVSIGGKGYPCRVHSVGELLRRVGSQKRLSPVAEHVEDEGDLERMACAEESIELR